MAAQIDPSKPFIISSSDETQALRLWVERIQVSGVLGEARQRRLFDYLAEKSLAGQSPKEIAVRWMAQEGPNFDVSQGCPSPGLHPQSAQGSR